MYRTLRFKIRGVSPLLMHNGQLADPLNEWTKALKKITSKRKKTDADYAEMSRIEWYGSLYLKAKIPCVPGWVLEAVLINGSKKKRMGTQAKIAIFCDKDYLLEYDGPRNIDELWEGDNHRLTCGVRVQRARIMRTRPKFENWGLEFDVLFEDEILNQREIEDIVEIAGRQVGLMDWRPKFGRFQVLECQEVES